MTGPVRAHLGLGSNLGDSRALLAAAVAALDAEGHLHAVSGLYRTEPIGGPDQDPFLNLVVELTTGLGPFALLERSRGLERAAQRRRVVRWGPRTLDVDVLLYDSLHLATERLTIPHPRMWDRAFVLRPLADVAPDLVSADDLARVADQGIERIDDL